MKQKVFQAYSDESGINDEDLYTSVSIVSGEEAILNCLRDKLSQEISNKRIKEVKFVKVTSYKSTIAKAAKTFIYSVVNDFAIFKKLRIDTITVDNQYLLSTFPDYDKEQKLEHMYYCLLAHMVRRWNNAQWYFYPDVNSKINWNEIISYLNMTKLHKKRNKNPLLIELMLEENPRFKFVEIKQLPSIQEPLIQLADLFAGLARFSHEENVDCTKWVVGQKNWRQQEMKFYQESKVKNITQTRECRYKLIQELYYLCHQHGFGVSIKTKKHLWTRKPNSPINFWDYEKR